MSPVALVVAPALAQYLLDDFEFLLLPFDREALRSGIAMAPAPELEKDCGFMILLPEGGFRLEMIKSPLEFR